MVEEKRAKIDRLIRKQKERDFIERRNYKPQNELEEMLMQKLANKSEKTGSRYDRIDNARTKVIRRAGLID
jgi:hypothetical protein